MQLPDISLVKDYFLALQTLVCEQLSEVDGRIFSSEMNSEEYTQPRILEKGRYLEKAAVLLSHNKGARLPAAASERNPHLAGKPFEAAAISMIVHPWNPYVPTFHANLRFFVVDQKHWYFGGGFDLTPCYPFPEDILHWHRTAASACQPFGKNLYKKLKVWCDEYFFLPHRQESRGVGGIFFDDWTHGGFKRSFSFVKNVGDHILPAYLPILNKRKAMAFGSREEEFMLYRRGRYAEFNLAIDRGTRYGLQSGRKIESVLASMPPRAIWKHNWSPGLNSPEADLYNNYLKPRDWIRELV